MKNENQDKTDKDGIGDIINQFFRSYGLEKRMKEFGVIEAWPELMGKGVANRTVSLQIRNKTLHIQLNSSVMRDELNFGKQVIIQRVNEYAGYEMIDDIWFT